MQKNCQNSITLHDKKEKQNIKQSRNTGKLPQHTEDSEKPTANVLKN